MVCVCDSLGNSCFIMASSVKFYVNQGLSWQEEERYQNYCSNLFNSLNHSKSISVNRQSRGKWMALWGSKFLILSSCFIFRYICFSYIFGLPSQLTGKESACDAGDLSLIPGSGRSTGEEISYPFQYFGASLVAQLVKNLPVMWETWVRSLAWEDPLEKGKTIHSSILAWRIPWTV